MSFDDDDRVAYHHLWDVVAWHLGIGDAASVAEPGAPSPHAWAANHVLPLGVGEMDALYGWLSTELQHPTSQGCRLAKTLVEELALPLPRPLEGMPAVVVRYLIGDKKADWLQVERGGFTELLAVRTGRLEELVRRGSRVPGGPMLMSLAGTTLTRYALREFVARSRGQRARAAPRPRDRRPMGRPGGTRGGTRRARLSTAEHVAPSHRRRHTSSGVRSCTSARAPAASTVAASRVRPEPADRASANAAAPSRTRRSSMTVST